jgi:carbamoyl-phosphate synthase small subunit
MMMAIREAALVLADGSVFEGEAIGAEAPSGISTGEVVFNTVLSGYQEVVTDPSYAGQIITFTYPHIGNYGTTVADDESRRPFCRGVIVRDLARRHSNFRAEQSLDELLKKSGISGIAGIDTRRLTRILRDTGAMPGAFGTASQSELLAAARAEKGTDGIDLVATVTTDKSYSFGNGPLKVVAYDFGIKTTILRCLSEIATIEIVPASTTAAEVLARQPHGVFLSNGPGDPATMTDMIALVQEILAARIPLFGICFGHQIIGRALGFDTYKLPFGHRGINQPVKNLHSGKIEITAHNHGFAVAAPIEGNFNTIYGAGFVSHICLNDGVVEGLELLESPAFSVQYHPEASAGPHDSRYLFDQFIDNMHKYKN